MTVSSLPHVNACFNAASVVLIVCGFIAIRRGRKRLHAGFMIAALASSAAFLVGYLVHKAYHGTTTSGHMGAVRPLYLGILLSHTVLAIANLPLVVVTVFAAARGNWSRHRRWARRTLPVWLYVSVTGVLVYLLLYHWFPVPGKS